ncbi:DNA polymerase alpha-binding protein [Trichomonascus vanleenenianus]|uniref:chromatin-binding protein CTF4 n=1 Tax=Trichomonascus vanleenenianus TaxID=2268995 RepID=UPI003ECAA6F9
MEEVKLPDPLFYHSNGVTKLEYSRGEKAYLVTVGSDHFARRHDLSKADEEATHVEQPNGINAVSVSATHFVVANEDSEVVLYDLASMEMVKTIVRTPLPMKDVNFSPDGEWIAVCGEDSVVRIIKGDDIDRFIEIEHPNLVKHVSFHPDGMSLTTSCVDGTLRVYSLSSELPSLVTTIEGVIPKVFETTEEKFTGVAWHPDGRCFAAPTKTFEIAIYSRQDWNENRRLRDVNNNHANNISALRWSPNGRFLASGDTDGRLLIWEAMTQEVIARAQSQNGSILSIDWHPTNNLLSFTTNEGCLFVVEDVVKFEPARGRVELFPLRGEALADLPPHSGETNGTNEINDDNDDDDAMMDNLIDDDAALDDFIEDDDGAGYAEPKKRAFNEDLGMVNGRTNGSAKKSRYEYTPKPVLQQPFQSGGTPWKSNRRYMCMNSIGYVWTVTLGTSTNTITVEFYNTADRHQCTFTEQYNYTMASLSPDACFVANSERAFFRFHEGQRDNWEYIVDKPDSIRAIAVSNSLAVICTERGYIRVFNIYGTPLKVFRNGRDPIITIACWNDYFMFVRSTQQGNLIYSIEDLKTGQTYQKDDIVDIPEGADLKSVFFSEAGDPCIYDSNNILLVLSKWREPLQAKWIPLFSGDQANKDKAKEKGDDTSPPEFQYWPLGLVDSKFMAIILKSAEKYPPFPLPLFSEIEVSVPVDDTTGDYERKYLTFNALHSLQKDRLVDEEDDAEHQESLGQLELEMDKALLYQVSMCCKSGRSSQAIGLAKVLNNIASLEAAKKVALRFEMIRLAEQIDQLIEQKQFA